MNLDLDFFQVSKLSDDFTRNGTLFFSEFRWRPKKKGLHRKWNTFFPEFRWTSKTKTGLHQKWNTFFKYWPALRCTPESNYWRGCRWRPYSNCWGGYSQMIGGDISPPSPPPLFRHHCYSPSVACQPKCKIKKHHVFSTSETVFRTEIDQKVI